MFSLLALSHHILDQDFIPNSFLAPEENFLVHEEKISNEVSSDFSILTEEVDLSCIE